MFDFTTVFSSDETQEQSSMIIFVPSYFLKIKKKNTWWLTRGKIFSIFIQYVGAILVFQKVCTLFSHLIFTKKKKRSTMLLCPCGRWEKLRYKKVKWFLKGTHHDSGLGQRGHFTWPRLPSFLLLCHPRGFSRAQSCKQPNSGIYYFSQGIKVTKSQQHESGFFGLGVTGPITQMSKCVCACTVAVGKARLLISTRAIWTYFLD